MTLVLATTWRPRGEIARFERLLPVLLQSYTGITIILPPVADEGQSQAIETLAERQDLIQVVRSPEWSWGRYLALKYALAFNSQHIQYGDMDRMIHWVETQPAAWSKAVTELQSHDCTVIGRSSEDYQTHPQALIHTEAISNLVVSNMIGKKMDFSAGSKGFSRQAALFLMRNATPGRALGTDAQWPVLLHRGSFHVHYLQTEGLDWESADRYLDQAATPEQQRKLAQEYDLKIKNWESRVAVAYEIVVSAYEAFDQELNPVDS